MKRLGVIRGGNSHHYESSIREGGELIYHILHHLPTRWKPVDVLLDRQGVWHAGGIPVEPAELSQKADLFWDATRSDAYLSLPGLPIVGVSGGSHSFSEESKRALKEHMKNIGVKTLRHVILPPYNREFDGPLGRYAMRKAMKVFEKFSPPWQVRLFPENTKESSRLAKTFPDLVSAITEGAEFDRSILVEESVPGNKFTTHSVRGFRDKEIYVFPTDQAAELLAKNLHEYLPAAYYVSAGFILHPKRGAYLSGFEFSPDLGESSHFTESCGAIGAKTHHVIEHILDHSLKKLGL